MRMRVRPLRGHHNTSKPWQSLASAVYFAWRVVIAETNCFLHETYHFHKSGRGGRAGGSLLRTDLGKVKGLVRGGVGGPANL